MLCDRLKRSANFIRVSGFIKLVSKHLSNPYTLGLLTVITVSVSLRFWQLSRFNALVFDEVYFAKFAQAYLAGAPKFDAHPPLGKYFIAAGIWLVESAARLLTFQQQLTPAIGIAPLSYRWMNALVGSSIPPLVFGLSLYVRSPSASFAKADVCCSSGYFCGGRWSFCSGVSLCAD